MTKKGRSVCLQTSLTACLADRRGTSGTEFALLLPMLTLLLMGVFDYGSLVYDSMQVSAAAHAGADYALHNGWSATGVQTAVTGATTLPQVSATPAPQLTKACIVSGAVVTATGSTCAGGGTPGSYVVVNAQAPFTPLISWAAFALPSTISAQATVRIQ